MKKKKEKNFELKNAFTLIELLAVIVILAIIAVITVPNILNVIDKSKERIIFNSTKGYIDAINQRNYTEELDHDVAEDGKYSVSELDVSIKGAKPTNGYVTIKDGEVSELNICLNNYSIDYKDEQPSISKNDYCSTPKVELTLGNNEQTLNVVDNESEIIELENIEEETNIICNNGAVPSLNDTKFKVSEVLGSVKCYVNETLNDSLNNSDNSENNIVMINDENIEQPAIIQKNKSVNINMNGFELNYKTELVDKETVAIVNNGNLKLFSSTTPATINSDDVGIRNDSGTIEIENININALRLAVYSKKDNYIKVSNANVHCGGEANQCVNIAYGDIDRLNVESDKIIALYTGDTVNVSNSTFKSSNHVVYHVSGILNLKNCYVKNTKETYGVAAVAATKNGIINISGDMPTFNDEGEYINGTYIDGNNSTSIYAVYGTINMNGGYYKSAFRTINSTTSASNEGSGIININDNVYVKSTGYALYAQKSGKINLKGEKAAFDENGNYLSGIYIETTANAAMTIDDANINLCGGTLKTTSTSTYYDIYSNSTGYIYYNSKVELLDERIYNENGRAILDDTKCH